ncbi:hypothetical protein SNEBB_009887 [Seison nebaliae]|nr:hypothetical protein SNEBB_009887 [Seison nebaliae]
MKLISISILIVHIIISKGYDDIINFENENRENDKTYSKLHLKMDGLDADTMIFYVDRQKLMTNKFILPPMNQERMLH